MADRVYLLDTYPFGMPNVVGAYLITGPKATIVDCGYASSFQNVLAGLAEVGLSPSEVRYLVPTHVHLDHAGATGHLLQRMPNAGVIAHEKGVPHLVDPTRLVESATRLFGSQVMEAYGAPLPVPAERITAVGKEMHLDLGDGLSATLIHSPGHAPHQVSVMIEGRGMLLTADSVGVVYPATRTLIPTTPPPSFDPAALTSSIKELRQTDPSRLLVPHFGSRDDVDSVFDLTKEKVEEWVKRVGEMRNRRMEAGEIVDAMTKAVRQESGTDDLPLYVLIGIRNSVMGIMHYLDKNP